MGGDMDLSFKDLGVTNFLGLHSFFFQSEME